MSIRAFVPAPLRDSYRRLRSSLRNRAFGQRNADIFGRIYDSGAWGRCEASDRPYSGPGSYDRSVAEYVSLVRDVIAANGVRTVLEIGCGDFAVGSQYASDVERYVGVDVAPNVVAYNQARHARGGIRFVQGDAARDEWGPFDLCLIRQVLQHLSNRDIAAILDRTDQHRLVLVTEHLPAPGQMRKPNLDKRSGPDTRVAFGSGVLVDDPPFSREGEVLLEVPVSHALHDSGEVLRTILIRNR